MVGILGLQRAHQEFKLGKPAETLETRVFQEKGPARESSADTPLKPLKGGFASFYQGENASDLIIRMVRVPK
jgi:hypothetical protein